MRDGNTLAEAREFSPCKYAKKPRWQDYVPIGTGVTMAEVEDILARKKQEEEKAVYV